MKKEPAKIQELRTKLVEHLEFALAVSDEIGDYATGSLIERALEDARADPFTDQPPRFGATPKCRRFTANHCATILQNIFIHFADVEVFAGAGRE